MKYWVAFLLSVVICAGMVNPHMAIAEETNEPMIEQVEMSSNNHLSEEAYEHIWNLLICLTITVVICGIILIIYSEK